MDGIQKVDSFSLQNFGKLKSFSFKLFTSL